MRDWDNKEEKEATWLREHNSVNPQSLFISPSSFFVIIGPKNA